MKIFVIYLRLLIKYYASNKKINNFQCLSSGDLRAQFKRGKILKKYFNLLFEIIIIVNIKVKFPILMITRALFSVAKHLILTLLFLSNFG